jgi:hypothetical protein
MAAKKTSNKTEKPSKGGKQLPMPYVAKPREGRRRTTFHMDASIIEKSRDCVVALSGPPERMTLVKLVETALERYMDELAKKYNKGRPFPPRKSEVHGGRPIGS